MERGGGARRIRWRRRKGRIQKEKDKLKKIQLKKDKIQKIKKIIVVMLTNSIKTVDYKNTENYFLPSISFS